MKKIATPSLSKKMKSSADNWISPKKVKVKKADGGCVKKAKGGEVKDHWIQDAVNPKTKGLLHKKLGVPQGDKIPEKKLAKALHSKSKKLRQEAQFAKNVKK